MRLEILVKRVAPDKGLIVDENNREWSMVEQRLERGEFCWKVETKVKGRLIQGIYDDVVIRVKSWTEISRYMQT